MKIYTLDPKKNKRVMVGIVANGIFKFPRNPQKHTLRIFPGYAIQEDVLKQLVDMDIKEIMIGEPHMKFRTSLVSDWQEHGKTLNLGSGPQRALSFKYMPYVERAVVSL